ncbi:MAG: hypothetical protein HKN12_11915, partial [Gemmatimonadetes bacterium]|nr:hypothetical protein [Gemmatimonadota bacterium]
MRRIVRLALFAALPMVISCGDDERNPFDPASDRTAPQLANFEIVTENQTVFATWSASEPVKTVVEYVRDTDGTAFYSYPADRAHAEAGVIKLVGIDGNTDFTLTGVRLEDRAGNEAMETVEGLETFRTSSVADEDLFYFAMIDVGWGDALYFEAPDGTNTLVDAGHPLEPDSRPPGGRHPVRWFLEKRGVTSLDFASLSHVHNDHIGGFYGDSFDNVDGLLQNQGGPYQPFRVGMFLDIGDKTPGTENGPYADLQ